MIILPRRPSLGILLGISALAVTAPAGAAAFIDPSAIDREVSTFTGEPVGGIGGGIPVDRRLRLAECSAPLALSWHGGGHDTVTVQCSAPGGWHVFVPLRRGATATSGGGSTGVAAVARGEEVTVAITGDGFTVSQSGEALEGGVIGDWIRVSPVKDSKSASEPIRAQIVRPGLVAVLLP